MKIIGIILIAFGAIDLIGSFAGFDLWGTIGVQLPDTLWKYSAYIEIGAGYFLMQLGGKPEEASGEPAAATEE
ncbi:MAG: hypothetical protein V2I33_05250 [Kangiellaceae bacterium]|jgi:hypothetical protein|nr:hypothetical protein [Kangiellaceae bacterium]